jgi:hypothetical protein
LLYARKLAHLANVSLPLIAKTRATPASATDKAKPAHFTNQTIKGVSIIHIAINSY